MKVTLSRVLRSGVALLLAFCLVAGFIPTAAFATETNDIEDVEVKLTELYNLLQTYGPEIATQVWNQWVEYGYVEAVETTINELEAMLTARYEYYTTEALPAIEEAVKALAAEKDALVAELAVLNAQLAEKKAELEAILNPQEAAPNAVASVNNHEAAEETVEAELEAAIADLEHAIAVIEALIADIDADIDAMVALAEAIAAAVAELQLAMGEVQVSIEELKAAFKAVEYILTTDPVDTTAAFEAARATALAAAEVLELTLGVADEIAADIDVMIEKLVADGEALYNKFISELPGCIEQIPADTQMMIIAAIAAAQQAAEEKIEALKAELPGKIEALKAEYLPLIEAKKAELEILKAQILAEIEAKYEEIKPLIEAEYEAQIAALEAKKAELTAQLEALQAELAALAEDAAQEVIDQLQAQIDRVAGDLAIVNTDLECALGHLENALNIAYEEVAAEINALYAEAVAALEAATTALEAALENGIADLKAAVEAQIAEIKAALEAEIAKLEALIDQLPAALDSLLQEIQDELAAVQAAIEGMLNGTIDSIEDLKDALVALGLETVAELVDQLVDLVNGLLEQATTADLFVDDEFKYVAIGDGSAATESYVEKLAEALNAECAKRDISSIEVVNNAKLGNTVAAELANLSDVSDADLITIGFSNVDYLNKAVDTILNGDNVDWAAVVGAENVQYVEQILAEVAAKLAEAGIDGEKAAMVNAAIEAYAYSAVLYAVQLPQLINEINAVNPDALVIIVGMYNPLQDTSIAMGEATLNIGEYVDYLVDAVAVHGIGYSLLSGNSIYVHAPAVATDNSDKELTITDLIQMIRSDFASLYPSAAGDAYIAAEIADALNITYGGMLGDANGDGLVNTIDAMLVLQYYNELIGANKIRVEDCDVDGSGVVNTIDAMLILQYYTEEIPAFPAA